MMAKPIAHDVDILMNSFLSGLLHFWMNWTLSVAKLVTLFLVSSTKFAIY